MAMQRSAKARVRFSCWFPRLFAWLRSTKAELALAADSLVHSSALAQQRHGQFGTHQPWRRPASATHNIRPAAHIHDLTNISYPQHSSSHTRLWLDQHQIPTTFVQPHTFMTWPTSATRNIHPAIHVYDSTNIRYPQRSSSCFSSTSTITSYRHQPTNQGHNYHELYTLVKTIINCHLCYNCYLAFVSFIVFWLSLLTCLTI